MHPVKQIIVSSTTTLMLVVTTLFSAQSIGGFNVYYGDLHNHCTIDDNHAIGTPADAYAYARNTAGMDFLGLTSHDSYITSTEWTSAGVAADNATVEGSFVGFRGFEWTTGYLGHIAILNSDDFCTSAQTAARWVQPSRVPTG